MKEKYVDNQYPLSALTGKVISAAQNVYRTWETGAG